MECWPAMAELLLDALGDRVAAAGQPTWVAVMGDPSGVKELDLRLVEDPRGLLAWKAPPECSAVGVVATGKAHVADAPIEGRMPFTPGVIPGIRMSCLVARTGDVAWHMDLPDGRSFEDAPQEGRLLDCLKRCFALPTPPPPVGAGHLLSVFWLGAIIDQVHRSDRRLTWTEVARLHPAAQVMSGCGRAGSEGPDLSDIIRVSSSAWSWEALRVQAETGSWARELVSADLAAWMDEGMFARWVLSALPAPDELVARIRPRLAPSTARRLAHAIKAAAAA
jgi:hypothetical protein